MSEFEWLLHVSVQACVCVGNIGQTQPIQKIISLFPPGGQLKVPHLAGSQNLKIKKTSFRNGKYQNTLPLWLSKT